MAEPGVYLEKISAFSRMLRLEGLPVGPQETADACRLLTEIGLSATARAEELTLEQFIQLSDGLPENCVAPR